jgi:hypothetical protein
VGFNSIIVLRRYKIWAHIWKVRGYDRNERWGVLFGIASYHSKRRSECEQQIVNGEEESIKWIRQKKIEITGLI